MLEAVGHPHAVNPDRELRRVARDRGWPVLVFDKPVALRSRIRLPPAKPTLAALAVGGAVAVGGAIWLNRAPHGSAPEPGVAPGCRRHAGSDPAKVKGCP